MTCGFLSSAGNKGVKLKVLKFNKYPYRYVRRGQNYRNFRRNEFFAYGLAGSGESLVGGES
jgi:hypothetical protein